MNSEEIHGSQKRFLILKNQINSLAEPNKSVLSKYLAWHEIQLQGKTITYSSVNRSLGIALLVCDKITNVKLMETAPLEKYWSETLQRKAIRKSQGKIVELEKNLSAGSFHKLRSQIIKFYKFIYFLNKYPDKELSLFKSSSMPKPDCCTFLNISESKQREGFKLPSQKQVKDLIEDLFKSKHYYAKMAGVFVAISNDCGLRFSEIATLKRNDIELIENFYLLGVSESKTAKRVVICALGKKFLDKWFEQNTKGEYVFESLSKSGKKVIVYNCLRKYLISSAKNVGISLMPGHAFHTFRHCASSRLREMPQNEKHYFLGWKLPGLESVYTRVGWEDCKKHYFESLRGNVMLDFTLSEFEEKQKNQEEIMLEQIRIAVQNEMKKQKT